MMNYIIQILNSISSLDLFICGISGALVWDIIDQHERAQEWADREVASRVNKYKREIVFLRHENKKLIKGIRQMQEDRDHE